MFLVTIERPGVFWIDNVRWLEKSLDLDFDGMSDAWELSNFGDLGRDGLQDWDADGQIDLYEFRTGNNPTDASSVLRIMISRMAESTTITFGAQQGRRYYLRGSENLVDQQWRTIFVTPAYPAAMDGSITVPSSSAQQYYRLEVQCE